MLQKIRKNVTNKSSKGKKQVIRNTPIPVGVSHGTAYALSISV